MKTIIATGPHGFAGAGRILCQNLIALTQVGYSVYWIGLAIPFPLSGIESGLNILVVDKIASDAIGSNRAIFSQETLLVETIAEKMAKVALDNAQNSEQIIFWGTYCHPYGLAALIAKNILAKYDFASSLWITPAGSDIWEVGPQLQTITEFILDNPHTTRIITYSKKFAEEISINFSVNRRIDVIPPFVDLSRFYLLTEDEKLARREELGIHKNEFVITSHSNMRPVKHPEDVLHIAIEFAKASDAKISLIMLGPQTDWSREFDIDNLTLIETGIVHNVERFLQISDVEINCSHHDSYNLSLAEAMACGVPCITTDVVGIAPIIEELNGGFLFPYLPISERIDNFYLDAVDYLLKLSKEQSGKTQNSEKLSTYAHSYFSTDRYIQRFQALIESGDE